MMRSALIGGMLVIAGLLVGQWLTGSDARQVLSELKAIRAALEDLPRQAPPAQAAVAAKPAPVENPIVKVSIDRRPSMGKADAPLTLVEFADYQCPFCTRFHKDTFQQLKQTFIETGLVRFVSRDLPLAFHAKAEKAAQAAHCAGDQEKFWPMRDALLQDPSKLDEAAMLDTAKSLSVDLKRFSACVSSDQHLADIRQDVTDASGVGITGTPGFVLGKASGNTVEGVKISGARPYQYFADQINQRLPAKR